MPVVSVVVPIFNVEAFLDECLESIVVQSHSDLEVVLIEDGSTDESAALAARFVERDERFTLHRFENAGLGAARNRGAALATGDYLMFVDSDDVVPVDAISVMVASLVATGSDFATGRVMRFDSRAVWRAPLTGRSFDAYRRATHITERPDLVYDTTAWNKLFRRSFWDRHDFAFPEGVVYEDIALMARCHLSAARVDVVPEVVYRWRSRDFGGLSITQDRVSVAALRDRLDALRQARRLIVEHGDEELVRSFDKKVIHLDVRLYGRSVPESSIEFQRVFVDGFGELVRMGSPEIPVASHMAGVVDALRRDDPRRVLPWCAVLAGDHASQSWPLRLSLDRPSLAAAGRRGRSAATRKIRGLARRLEQPLALLPARVPTGRVPARAARQVSRALVGRPGATINRLSCDLPTVRRRIWSGFGREGLVTVRFPPTAAVARRIEVTADELTIEFLDAPGTLIAVGESFGCRTVVSRRSDATFAVPFELLEQFSEHAWRFEVQVGAIRAEVVTSFDFAPSAARFRRHAYSVLQSGGKTLRVVRRHVGATVEVAADVPGSMITVVAPEGTTFGAARLAHDHTGVAFPIPALDGDAPRTAWRLDLSELRKWQRPTPLRHGRWHLEVRHEGRWVRAGTSPADPVEYVDPDAWSSYTLVSAPDAVTLTSRGLPRVEGDPDLARQNNEAIAARLRQSSRVRDVVVFECFYGRQFACHPRALLEPIAKRLPGAELLWVTQPGQTYAPPGTRPLVRWTTEWYEQMACASLVVTNADLAPSFRRHHDQVVLQTWHGTPLKRIALDMITFDNFRSTYREEIVTQSEQWTHLLSPNDFCSNVFPTAFGFSGRLIEAGSPRNDVLIDGDLETRSARVRADLGLGPSVRIVLVAPTWRETVTLGSQFAAMNTIDLESLAASLGPDVRILYRAHSNVSRQRGVPDTDRVVNVSDFPDIAELYLAADVLVTDYSSVMFDFACLHRPMVFHCPDLETYRDEIRGWYLDFTESAPGPITRTSSELRSALHQALAIGVSDDDRDRYDAFCERYTAWEDGHASERVADVVTQDVLARHR